MRNFAPMIVKRTLLTMLWATLTVLAATAQRAEDRAFDALLYNNVYEIMLRLNLYDQDINVPGHELYGPLPGYLQRQGNSFTWAVVSAEVTSPTEARLQLINEYGSDDLTAELTQTSDSTYTLRQLSGATLKVPKDRKWLKLPKTLELKRKNK